MARILRCCGCGAGRQLQLIRPPSLGTSICRGYSPKKQKKRKKILNPISTSKKKLYLFPHVFCLKNQPTGNQFIYMLAITEWMFMSPQDLCWNPNPWGDGIRRRSLWEGIRSWARSPHEQIVSPESSLTSSAMCEDGQREDGLLWARKQALSPDSESASTLTSDFPASKTVRNK